MALHARVVQGWGLLRTACVLERVGLVAADADVGRRGAVVDAAGPRETAVTCAWAAQT